MPFVVRWLLLRVLTPARCELVAFLKPFLRHERTSVNPGLSHVSESESTSGLSIDSEMYSFASGTIVSARTSSPSMPGTQPVSSNISLAVSRRALTLVVALLMIGFPVLVHWTRRFFPPIIRSPHPTRYSRNERLGIFGGPPITRALRQRT